VRDVGVRQPLEHTCVSPASSARGLTCYPPPS
jgi:hypothetical protein